MFRSQQIIIREYVCTSLKLLNYLKNIEFKIVKIIPGVVAAKRVAGIRGDPCGAVSLTSTCLQGIGLDSFTFSVILCIVMFSP